MAHTKAKGTTKLGRDSQSQRLGVKIYGGSAIRCGQIIIRQRGTAFMAGDGVKTGKDDTLYAVRDGVVLFKKIRYLNFNGNKKIKQRVSVQEISKTKVESSNKVKSSKVKIADTDKIEKTKTVDEKNFTEKLNTENKESLNAKSKSQYIAEEQPIKNIPLKKETKK